MFLREFIDGPLRRRWALRDGLPHLLRCAAPGLGQPLASRHTPARRCACLSTQTGNAPHRHREERLPLAGYPAFASCVLEHATCGDSLAMSSDAYRRGMGAHAA